MKKFFVAGSIPPMTDPQLPPVGDPDPDVVLPSPQPEIPPHPHPSPPTENQ